ncbi:UNVERIFIED_CONTAM: hypothetical protein Sradi_2029800 [Sesamum radiatum]|uniref:Uncharacterized protein n=1 Tax=Sesamum radiatum TaxID=300843 RepID=A0AAW2TH84_SESRA
MLSLKTSVNELMLEDGGWNEEATQEIFRLEDVIAILPIPLMAGVQDRLHWHFEKHGRYSVRSAKAHWSGSCLIRVIRAPWVRHLSARLLGTSFGRLPPRFVCSSSELAEISFLLRQT